jgi:regulator of PEP synthase PpsR (kinase-PPPase family)
LEQRLSPLGFHLVLLTRSEETFEEARTERLKVSGNPMQYDDLRRFIDEQKLFLQLAGESSLPCLIIDISDNDIQRAAERIADWLEETGGLWMSD